MCHAQTTADVIDRDPREIHAAGDEPSPYGLPITLANVVEVTFDPPFPDDEQTLAWFDVDLGFVRIRGCRLVSNARGSWVRAPKGWESGARTIDLSARLAGHLRHLVERRISRGQSSKRVVKRGEG